MTEGPWQRLRTALTAWRERVAAAHRQAPPAGWERSVRRLHVLAHRHQSAGRHDPRRRHWRRYLADDADDD